MNPSLETVLIWGGSLLLIATILAIYHRAVRNQERKNLLMQREAVELGNDRPPVQHPQIDPYLCIGCGSCVAACPEGDVLGMVAGKASIINGFRCVGHGRCAKACPVGAVQVGLGDRHLRPDLPLLDASLQTNRSGIFIAGELGGLGLIKNAVEQGRQAALACIENLAQQRAKTHGQQEEQSWDVLVIGGGPAGLSAGITLLNHGHRALVLEQHMAGGSILQYPRKSLALTKPVDIPAYGRLKKNQYSKEHLLEIWQTAIDKTGLEISTGSRVTNIHGQDGQFKVTTQQGDLEARNIILALGRRGSPRKLGAPGETLPKVAYQLIDAVTYTDDHILVVGGGDSAVEAALALSRQPGNEVTLSYRRGRFFRIRKINRERLDAAVAAGKIRVIFNSHVSAIEPEHVTIHTQEEVLSLRNDYVFILIGGIPPFGLLEKIGIQMGGGDLGTTQVNTG